ncbi:M48 family metalloprotease [Candidatus Woesearchaeota archaeon]|nr:M48 family metalloprotease [Candidatus Woesearchaeota archaeon]
MMCGECVQSFVTDPLKLWLSIGSLVFALLALAAFFGSKATKTKLGALYLHVFFLLFPVVLYGTYGGCAAMLDSCETARHTIWLAIITSGISILVSLLCAPFVFVRRMAQRSRRLENGSLARFVASAALDARITSPALHVIDTAKPIAFSFSLGTPRIFVSVGLMDLLSKKETEAVLLHEIGHIAQKSSMLALSRHAALISPVAWFGLERELDREERTADQYAARRQGSNKHIRKAKQHLNSYRLATIGRF